MIEMKTEKPYVLKHIFKKAFIGRFYNIVYLGMPADRILYLHEYQALT